MWRSLVLVAVLGTSARADETLEVDPEQMTSVPIEGDVCAVLDGFDECNLLVTRNILRLGRASVIERLGDGVTHFDLVIESTEGRWITTALTATSNDCGMHHCTESVVSRGPTLRVVTIGGRPSVLFEARTTTTETFTDPDTGKGRLHHTSTSMFFACTRTKENNPGWMCLHASVDAGRCTLSVSGAGKVRTGCTSELTFDQPTD